MSSRLEQVFQQIDQAPHGKSCDAILGIIEEGQEVMKEYKGKPAARCRLARRSAGGRALRDRPLRHPEDLGRPSSASTTRVPLLEATLGGGKEGGSDAHADCRERGEPARRGRGVTPLVGAVTFGEERPYIAQRLAAPARLR